MQLLDRVDPAAIRAFHERGEFFWLDLYDPSDEELVALAEVIEIPPLALEDTREFGQRPKVDDYGRRVLVVFYGADGDLPIEVHVHLSGEEVVTVRRGHCAHLGEAHQRVREGRIRTEEDLVYRILDATRSARSSTAAATRSRRSRTAPSSARPARSAAG